MDLRIISCVLLLAFSSFECVAQSAVYLNYNWDSKASIHAVSEADATEYPAVIILQNRILELSVTPNGANSYDTEHKIVHINNDGGIEKYNKVYIPLYGGRELVSLKVRSVDREGKVTEFNRANLKELKNVEGYGNFKIFAIEGLTKEGELEYLYTLKTTPQTYGREVFQHDVPVLEAGLEIIYPDRFTFGSKSYNGLKSMESSVLDNKRKSLTLMEKNIPALIEEQYSSYKSSLKKVDYKLESNGREINLMSWSSICEKMIQNFYDGNGLAKVEKLIKIIGVEGLSEIEKIKKIEKYIKTNFTVKEGTNDAYEDVKEIILSHVANERGITKLYMAIFHLAEIETSLVIACNKYRGVIDPTFSNVIDLNEILFYFPQHKSYLTPDVSYLRLGATLSSLAGSTAVFITYHFEGNLASYLKYSIRQIEPLDYTFNSEGVKAKVTFGEDMTYLEIDQENYWQGYRAAQNRGIYYYRPEESREEFFKNVTLSGIDNYTVLSRVFEGQDIQLSENPENYCKIKTRYSVSSLLEKAGDDYLLSVGKIIGKQSELYQEKSRKTDIVFHETSNYNHEIVLEVPKGYKCSGLESLKINNAVKQNGDSVMYFNSDYVLDGDKLTIKVNEVYKVLSLPKDKYSEFRTMVNSAADFNKVVLIFERI
jgi:hypothetical protein